MNTIIVVLQCNNEECFSRNQQVLLDKGFFWKKSGGKTLSPFNSTNIYIRKSGLMTHSNIILKEHQHLATECIKEAIARFVAEKLNEN